MQQQVFQDVSVLINKTQIQTFTTIITNTKGTYRYYNGKTCYKFGHGLSYSSFEYSKPILSHSILKKENLEKLLSSGEGLFWFFSVEFCLCFYVFRLKFQTQEHLFQTRL